MTIDRKNTKISAVSDFYELRESVMMFYEKEVIDHVLGNHKGARDYLVSRFLFTLNELKGRMLIAFRVKTTYFLAKKLPSFVFVVVHYTLCQRFVRV